MSADPAAVRPGPETAGGPPEIPELWAFVGRTGKWVGNVEDGYIGAFPSEEDARRARPFMEDAAASIALIGISPARAGAIASAAADATRAAIVGAIERAIDAAQVEYDGRMRLGDEMGITKARAGLRGLRDALSLARSAGGGGERA